MCLDCAFTCAQLLSNLLVERAACHQRKNFSLSGRERLVALPQVIRLSKFRPCLAITIQTFFDGIDQVLITKALWQESNSARLHRFNSHGNVTMASHENDGQRTPAIN